MNDDLIPFESEQLDELLSAALDGELDAAAHDLGLGVDEVTARLAATPGAEARRAGLAAAREHLAAPVEIDEVAAQRLLTTALRAADEDAPAVTRQPHRAAQWLLRSAGIAAAIAALVVVAFSVGGNHSNGTTSKSSSVAADSPARTSTTRAPRAALGSAAAAPAEALGSFSSAHDLAQAAVTRRALASGGSFDAAPTATNNAAADKAVPSARAQSGSAAGSSTTQYAAGFSDNSERSADKVANGAVTCPAPADVPVKSTPTLRATATLAGKPVLVTVFAGKSEQIVVIQNTDCTLVNVQMLG